MNKKVKTKGVSYSGIDQDRFVGMGGLFLTFYGKSVKGCKFLYTVLVPSPWYLLVLGPPTYKKPVSLTYYE